MRQRTARWLNGLAPFVFLGCGPTADPLPAAAHFGVLRAASTSSSHSAWANFTSDVSPSCSLTRLGDGCLLANCESLEASGVRVSPTRVTVQGAQTVVLDAENDFVTDGEGALFGNGDEVLFDIAPSADVPALRQSLKAPTSTTLTAPLPSAEPAPLELVAGADLQLEWVPGNNGLMKFNASQGLVSLSCEWSVADGEGAVLASSLAQLPVGDGSDSFAEFWTEQNTVVREDDWEFLLLLSGDVIGSDFLGYSRAE
jgi:hypothetical protein